MVFVGQRNDAASYRKREPFAIRKQQKKPGKCAGLKESLNQRSKGPKETNSTPNFFTKKPGEKFLSAI
jgi:hypothetical protein